MPPQAVPSMTDMTTVTSNHPLALTRPDSGTVSVMRPYFAGAYADAAMPTIAKASIGWKFVKMKATPTTFMAFMHAMSFALENASAKGPINGAKNT